MQQTEIIGSVAIASFAAMGAALAQYGVSWAAVVAACIGAFGSVIGMEPFRWRVAASLVIFNSAAGIFAGAILAHWLMAGGYIKHPLLPAGLTFLAAFVGHDWLSDIRDKALPTLLKVLPGGRK